MSLWPTKPPIHWAPGSLSPGVKWLSCEANHPSIPNAEERMSAATPALPHTPTTHA